MSIGNQWEPGDPPYIDGGYPKGSRKSQCERLLALLEVYHPGWVGLPRIMQLGIASHTRIISYLLAAGHSIECQREYIEGSMYTKYRLVKP
jgi:hypothetical protein